MEPRLLAAYRKYGSLAAGCPVVANHFCSSGALVATTKNGMPTTTASSASVAGIGLAPGGGIQLPTLNGPLGSRMISGTSSSTQWSSSWRRTLSQVLTEWV